MRFFRHAWLLCLSLWVTTGSALPLAPEYLNQADQSVQDLDRIVAVVNEEVILQSELNQFIGKIVQQLRSNNTPLPSADVLQRQALDRLIITRLQLQVAERSGIRVDEDTLNAAVRKIAQQNGMTVTQLRERLMLENYDFAQFRDDIRNEIALTRLRQQQVENRVRVTSQEVEDFLAQQERQGNDNQLYRFSHILVALPEAASPEVIAEKQAKAQNLYDQLQAGADFTQLAVAESDGRKALEGGDLGWLSLAQMPSTFAEALRDLQAGQMTPILRTSSGFHILKLEEVKSENRHIVQQTLVRHILIKPNELISEQEAQRRLLDIRERLQNGEDFGPLARAHSDDTLSAREGGSLGWVSPGTLVPRFERVMEDLSEGQISEPFRTRFGWHIVQVQERKQHDDTDQFMRTKATEYLRSRKAQEETELWLRRLRDESYIEIRLDS